MQTPQFDYRVAPLDELEDVLGVFYGGRGQVGQQLVLTNRRLLMGPLDVGVAEVISAKALDTAVPGAGSVVRNVLAAYGPMSAQTLWLRHVVDVRATNGARWFKAPGLRITTDTHQVFDVGIVRTPTTMNRDRRNEAARDEAVTLIKRAVAAAKAAAPPGR